MDSPGCFEGVYASSRFPISDILGNIAPVLIRGVLQQCVWTVILHLSEKSALGAIETLLGRMAEANVALGCCWCFNLFLSFVRCWSFFGAMFQSSGWEEGFRKPYSGWKKPVHVRGLPVIERISLRGHSSCFTCFPAGRIGMEVQPRM